MEQLVYLNGHLLPRGQALISPFDHGFLYGFGLFETMRSYSGHIFRLGRHLDRLAHSAEQLGLPLTSLDLEAACYDTLRANGLLNARIRLAVSMGEGEGTPDAPEEPRPTVFIAAAAYTPPSPDRYENGFNALISTVRQNSQSPLSRLKSANYLTSLLARREATAAGMDEALLLNERGFLCEGSTSNLFLAKGGSLVTPSLDSGCLPGVTRQAVLELTTAIGISCEERCTAPGELRGADEGFLTNSLLEVMPLREVDRSPVGGAGGVNPGSRRMTRKLMAAYAELVATETKSRP
jgi:branched-subunit amino acid aminotransferase/4-amino-4-deoxychorismate lyase